MSAPADILLKMPVNGTNPFSGLHYLSLGTSLAPDDTSGRARPDRPRWSQWSLLHLKETNVGEAQRGASRKTPFSSFD